MTYESKPPRIGLWKNDRGPHASGNCGGIRFVLWLNDKSGDRQPDYHLVIEAAQKREDAGQGYDPSKPGYGSTRPVETRTAGAHSASQAPLDDDIPF